MNYERDYECPNCNKKIKEHYKNCPRCGKKLVCVFEKKRGKNG